MAEDRVMSSASASGVACGPGTDVGEASSHHEDGLLAALDAALCVIGQALEADALRIDGDDQEALRYPLEWYRQAAGRPHQYEALIGGRD